MSDRIILFVCQGNACRSPMAEGYARIRFSEHQVYSAGIRPIGVDDRAIEVMEEEDVDIRDLSSTCVDEVAFTPNIVVSMSPSVSRKLPSFPSDVERITWSINDPYHAGGPREEQLRAFRTVRDHIKKNVSELQSEREGNGAGPHPS